MKYFFLFFTVVLIYGCPSYDSPSGILTVHNYSDSAIYVYCTCSDSVKSKPKLNLFEKIKADIIDEHGQKKDSIYSPNYRVNPYTYSEINVWGTVKNPELYCNNDIIYLFFIKESIMRTKKWEDICKYQLYEQKRLLTKDELNRIDWLIKYSPKNDEAGLTE